MKVGLFAPAMRSDWGGVWQFAQWVIGRVGGRVPMCVAVPSPLLAELLPSGVDPSVKLLDVDGLLRRTRATLAYRVLEANSLGRWGGMTVPYSGKVTRWVQKRFYHGSVTGHALLKELIRENVDVVHVPWQSPQYPDVVRMYPYVINPHDYQHEHFPEFFTPKELSARRNVWYAVQRGAAAVVVHSVQTRDDALKYLGVPEERVFYAPYGPLATFPDVDEATARRTAERLKLPERYVFYPARMWAHKNHMGLLEALARLKRRGIDVSCVFTDASGEHGARVGERTAALGLEGQVRAVGRVTPEEMSALYMLCTAVVVPSLFEQNSGPMLEAIHFCKPVAVSNIPELVQSLGGAGLVFDPRSHDAIAKAVDHIWSSETSREQIASAVRARKAEMSWEPFRDVYLRAYQFALERGNP